MVHNDPVVLDPHKLALVSNGCTGIGPGSILISLGGITVVKPAGLGMLSGKDSPARKKKENVIKKIEEINFWPSSLYAHYI